MKISRTVVIAVAAVLIGLVGLGAYAFARSDGVGPPWRDGPGWHDGDRGWVGWHGRSADPDRVRQIRAELAADLGAQLNTPAEDVEAAFRAVVAQRLEDAVADGRIDQAAVDEALAAYDAGDIGAVFGIVTRGTEEATERP